MCGPHFPWTLVVRPSLCTYFHGELPDLEGGCYLWEGRGWDGAVPSVWQVRSTQVSWLGAGQLAPQGRPLLRKECVPTTQIHMLRPHPQWDGVRWWGLWEVTGLG